MYACSLKPNNKFSFRVLAESEVGVSEPSPPSRDTCRTYPSMPAVNPTGVQSVDEGSDRLVITWQVCAGRSKQANILIAHSVC